MGAQRPYRTSVFTESNTPIQYEEPDAREVVQLIQQAGRKAVAIPGYLRNAEFCRRLVRDAHAELGGLDILVNCAS